MPKFLPIGGGLKDKCYVQIPDNIWNGLNDLRKKQITEAVEKGFIADAPGGIGIKKNPRYHISIKDDYRLCTQLKADFTSQKVKSSDLQPFASPFAGRTAATPSEQRSWHQKEVEAKKAFEANDAEITLKFLVFDREKDHATLRTA